jgi:hypothetical protein
MQGALGVLCLLLGVLWTRAVHRVRTNVLQRVSMSRRLATITQRMDGPTQARTVHAVVALQRAVRRWRRAVQVGRWLAMEAYDASAPHRSLLLWLLHALVALYLASCLYIVLLYGTSGLTVPARGMSPLPAMPVTRMFSTASTRFTVACISYPLRVCLSAFPRAAIKFSRELETAWLLSSALGFFLDVFVYHTLTLFLKSILKLRTCQCNIKLRLSLCHSRRHLLRAAKIAAAPCLVPLLMRLLPRCEST